MLKNCPKGLDHTPVRKVTGRGSDIHIEWASPSLCPHCLPLYLFSWCLLKSFFFCITCYFCEQQGLDGQCLCIVLHPLYELYCPLTSVIVSVATSCESYLHFYYTAKMAKSDISLYVSFSLSLSLSLSLFVSHTHTQTHTQKRTHRERQR